MKYNIEQAIHVHLPPHVCDGTIPRRPKANARDAAGTCQPLRCKGNLRVEIPSLSLSLTLTPSGGKGEQ
jgi:hypothetical protein